MITLTCLPKNSEKFIRLLEFCKEVMTICRESDTALVLNGSLALFAYAKDQHLAVNDVDFFCPEADFPKIIAILEERGINCILREWHVLQILRDDLKIELDSIEYWAKDLRISCETLLIDDLALEMLDLNSLKVFYWQAMQDRANKSGENERIKYETLKAKYELLESLQR